MIEKAEDLTVYVHSSRIVRNLNQVWNMKMYGYAHLRHVVCTCIVVVAAGWAGSGEAAAGSGARAFAQLDQELATANVYRTASGAPGSQYWQQQADYKIDVELDEAKRALSASAGISYTNNSPDSLAYLWLQLDQNRFADNSLDRLSRTVSRDRISYSALRQNQSFADNELGYRDLSVTDARGKPLPFTVVDTLMRIDLPTPLKPGRKIAFVVDWRFNIIEEVAIGGRGGYEHFEESDTYLFALAQWFPRLAAYSDFEGWHNKAFLGRGEFALEFGDYEVALTVPADHVVSASGVLTNPREVLSAEQRRRLSSVGTDRTTFIVTPEEALANQAERATGKKTWKFKASNVRDFAFASSRKFIWDAMLHEQPGADYERVLAMSFYPNEAEPIWSHYSTEAVVHTMEVYSRFSFDYPYPTSQSVNTWKSGGMEYPMITFNGYRPEPAKERKEQEDAAAPTSADAEAASGADTEKEPPGPTYSRRIKYGLIGVIIHEVGHIYFPMIVNSDERQWTWMDEGINTFLEYVAELEWEENYPAFGGKANVLDYIPDYMTSTDQVPIMTQSDSILQFGPNAYTKPAAALTVLRETVMGRELFDFAFKEYAQRWKFKRPTPADFFRTMEDASGVDLDWFWRGWFYTTDHVDIAISDIRGYRLKTGDPDQDFPLDRAENRRLEPEPITQIRNREQGIQMRLAKRPELKDFYNENDAFTVSNKDRNKYKSMLEGLEPWERRALERGLKEAPYIYFVDFENIGGLVSPLPLTIEYQDGTQRQMLLPAEIWRRNAESVTRVMVEDRPIQRLRLDTAHQTADADFSNNAFPPEIELSRFEVYKYKRSGRSLMADFQVELKVDDKAEGDEQERSIPLQPIGQAVAQ